MKYCPSWQGCITEPIIMARAHAQVRFDREAGLFMYVPILSFSLPHSPILTLRLYLVVLSTVLSLAGWTVTHTSSTNSLV